MQPLTRRPELIPLTVNEIRRMFAKLITNTVHTINHWLAQEQPLGRGHPNVYLCLYGDSGLE
jgi:hypothetical protein